MVSGRETMTCTGNRDCAMKSVTFTLMVLLNVVQSSFFICTIYMEYAMDIILCSFSVHVVAWKVKEHLR